MDLEFITQRHNRLRGYVTMDKLDRIDVLDKITDPNLGKKETILEEAARIVNGPRRQEYGHPKENFNDVAQMWTIVLREKLLGRNKLSNELEPITPDDVILMMLCLKICRGKQDYKRDTAVDIAGYAQCWELVNE